MFKSFSGHSIIFSVASLGWVGMIKVSPAESEPDGRFLENSLHSCEKLLGQFRKLGDSRHAESSHISHKDGALLSWVGFRPPE